MDRALIYPKLRWPLEIRLEAAGDQEVILLRCPLGISREPLVLISAVGPLLSQFQGSKSVGEIAEQFAVAGVTVELVTELAALLDKHLFLSSPRYFEAERTMKTSYLSGDVRPAALAGLSYPQDPEQLRTEISAYLDIGKPEGIMLSDTLVGVVSPHIDYGRGGHGYAGAYNILKGASPDLLVVAGTSHQYSRHMFHLTRKHFATPLGRFENDRDFVDRLGAAYGARAFADEILHKQEHSLELQLPFLAVAGKSRRMVPLLIGGFHQMLASGKSPQTFEEYESFAAALTALVRERQEAGQQLLFVAGVDMAHVGGYFGDRDRLTPAFMEHVAVRDREYLQAILDQDKDRLWAHIAEDEDARKVCGFPTMYLLLDVYDRLGIRYRAQLHGYHQAVDYEKDCGVTFAAVGLYR